MSTDGEAWQECAQEILGSSGAVGYRRLHALLKERGYSVAQKQVQHFLSALREEESSSAVLQTPARSSKAKPSDEEVIQEIVLWPAAMRLLDHGLENLGVLQPMNAGPPVPIREHKTGLSKYQVPVALSTFCPVFDHGERLGPLTRAMTPGGIDSRYGAHTSGVLGRALEKFTQGPMAGMSPGEVWRHVLAVYVCEHRGPKPPPDLAGVLDGFFVKGRSPVSDSILRRCLGENTDRCRPELRVSLATDAGPDLHVTVVALALSQTMDVWHSQNSASPASRELISQNMRRTSKKKGKSDKAKFTWGRFEEFEPCETPEDLRQRKREERMDEAFRALSFEEVLAQCKGELAACNGGGPSRAAPTCQ